jgi:Domain of unknown function (DUF6473)
LDRYIRGPAPDTLSPGSYFACVGAAQTFGCFCEKPFPALLGDGLGLYGLNCGFAGAGPRFFLPLRRVLEYVNGARFAIIQVMSGRSEDNSVFDSRGREYLIRRSDGQEIGAEPAYRHLIASESVERIAEIVDETRSNWVESYFRLLEAIKVPTILFWYSKRSPDLEDDFSNVDALFGEYPHMVNRAMVEQVRGLTNDYVECISSRGFPQRLVSRFTGEPVTIESRADLRETWRGVNLHYPSPEMHVDAAAALMQACMEYAH